jgi:hypothetical protein
MDPSPLPLKRGAIRLDDSHGAKHIAGAHSIFGMSKSLALYNNRNGWVIKSEEQEQVDRAGDVANSFRIAGDPIVKKGLGRIR